MENASEFFTNLTLAIFALICYIENTKRGKPKRFTLNAIYILNRHYW